jgi:hypothetical protein
MCQEISNVTGDSVRFPKTMMVCSNAVWDEKSGGGALEYAC